MSLQVWPLVLFSSLLLELQEKNSFPLSLSPFLNSKTFGQMTLTDLYWPSKMTLHGSFISIL